MLAKDAIKKLKVQPRVADDQHVNPLELLSTDEWNRKMPPSDKRQPSYRERAVKRAIEAKVSFSNEANCTLEMARVLLKATCPYCGKTLEAGGGGGAGCGPIFITNIKFKCEDCGTSVNLYLQEGSLDLSNPKGA